VVLIRPGASIPADGDVLEGASDVNESMITGESQPVGKKAPGRVIAGTVNGSGSLRVRVTGTGERTALAGIMRLVYSKGNKYIFQSDALGYIDNIPNRTNQLSFDP